MQSNKFDYYLKKFCGSRAIFDRPVLVGDYVYATNSYVALKVHKDACVYQYLTREEIAEKDGLAVPKIETVFEEPPNPYNGELLYNFFNILCGERIPICEEVCLYCDGEGFDHCGEINDEVIYKQCDHCEKGNVRAKQHESIDYVNQTAKIDVRLAVPYLALATEALAAFDESAFNVHHGKKHNAFHFNFSIGQILIMPLRK